MAQLNIPSRCESGWYFESLESVFNLVGYRHSAMPAGQGNRHELGGLTDATFGLIPTSRPGWSSAGPGLTSQSRYSDLPGG
jgi:hypothetical protein